MATNERTRDDSKYGLFMGALLALVLIGAIIVTAYAMRNWWLPPLASAGAAEVDRIMNIFFAIIAVVFVGVHITLVSFVLRYRKQDDGKAHFWHDNIKLELSWTIIPAAILIALTIAGGIVWATQTAPAPQNAMTVDVVGRQFYWQFTYPGPDGEMGTEDDFQTFNDLRVPVDRTVNFVLRSEDVIHSFFVPNWRLKQDLVPGRTTKLTIEPTEIGQYELACAELCGVGHYNMKANVTVMSQEDFDAWVQEQAQ